MITDPTSYRKHVDQFDLTEEQKAQTRECDLDDRWPSEKPLNN